ncbi:restriction endonuclease subunit S [Halobacillus sp. Nhm2S1]|uniref:restriction endonuclease subunit S n=1 Tax=Halobacillus sp. Nhm2S1 TaxID=2866716 RepID=UPI001C738542|nr:restriction endonuclease subunit S [Halobacillus sp. Nhm2S1]MBX0359161.1 restriction endonuclease subunit S [Halobacillus sp. Nhm2S1]
MTKKVKKTSNKMLEEALVPVEEQPYKIPDNWMWVKLKTVVDFFSGNAFPKKHQGNNDNQISFYKVGNLVNKEDDHYLKKSPNTITENERVNIKAKLIPKETIVFAKIGEAVKLNRRAKLKKESCIDNNLMGIRAKEKVLNNEFLFFWALSKDFYQYSQATAVPSIRKSTMEDIAFALPPYKEQLRIVNKVNNLVVKIKNAKQLNEKAIETFELRRAAILDKAFRGELTEGIVGESDNTDLTFEKESEVGRVYSIPSSWGWKKFKDVAKVRSNLVNPDEYQNLPLIAPNNIKSKTGQLIDYNLVKDSGVKSSKHHFYKGQILYSKIRPYLSKVIVAESDGLCSADMYPIETELKTEYLYWYMLSPTFLEKASTAGSRSVLPKINQKELGEIPVPVPPKKKQEEIVNVVNTILKKEANIYEKLELDITLNNLNDAILSKAFRGVLGTNYSDEESNIKLIEETF